MSFDVGTSMILPDGFDVPIRNGPCERHSDDLDRPSGIKGWTWLEYCDRRNSHWGTRSTLALHDYIAEYVRSGLARWRFNPRLADAYCRQSGTNLQLRTGFMISAIAPDK